MTSLTRFLSRPAPIALVTVASVAVAALSGCSAGTGETADAQAIVDQIVQRIPAARKTVVVTAQNDPNKLLGRPDAYTSKTQFIDTRLDQGVDVVRGVPAGGSVEVFPDESRARARFDYLRQAGDGNKIAPEYDYLAGPVLLRVSHNLTPDQAAEYQKTLDAIAG